jgi:light-regulated signal transduction histidine kinase (bacteriophytochrome)
MPREVTPRSSRDPTNIVASFQSQELLLFAEITLKIRQSLDLEEILHAAVTEVQKLLNVDRVLIFRLREDGSGTVLQEAVVKGFPVAQGQEIVDPCFAGEYQEKYRQGRVFAIADLESAEPRSCHTDFLKQFAVRANLVVPILQTNNLWGLLIAHQCRDSRHWLDSEVELLKQLANQIGIAIYQSDLLARSQQQSQELARSNAELEQFAYIASHDLQEPLRMVSSYLELLSKRYQPQLDSDAQEFIGYAIDGAKRMQLLIRDLLSYSRIATHGQPFVTVNSGRLLRDAIANLEISIEETKTLISHPDIFPEIYADPIQITQLFQNLLSNAIKFCQEIPPKIEIKIDRFSEEWLFQIYDNGIGIEAEYYERIFLVFQRLNRRDDYPGTGIGLAICQKIVDRHGGRIWVESQVGRGSIFSFTLPHSTVTTRS